MRRFLALTTVLLGLMVLLPASSARAAELTGCSGTADSKAKDGSKVDSITAPGPHGTRSDPFLVDWGGTVDYSGTSDSAITNHHWKVRFFFIPIKSGGSDNAAGKKDTAGLEQVNNDLPFRFAGLYYVSGFISGTGGSCTGSVWIKLTGNPVGTIPWIAAIVMALFGLFLLVRALMKGGRIGHLIRGLFGGLFLGIGLALLLISYALLPLGRYTPIAVAAGLLVIGILVGFMAPTGKAPKSPVTV